MLEDRELASGVGFWSAVLTTAAIVLWILITAINAFVPLHFWVNFSALLIAPAFLVLMASIHTYMPPGRKLWTLIVLVFAIMYAVIICQNYFLQMIVVRQNPVTFDLLSMAPNRKDSVFWALEILGYGFMSLAALFVSQAFANADLEYWIRRLFILNGIFAMIAAVGFVLTANPFHILSLTSLGVWSNYISHCDGLIGDRFQAGKARRISIVFA